MGTKYGIIVTGGNIREDFALSYLKMQGLRPREPDTSSQDTDPAAQEDTTRKEETYRNTGSAPDIIAADRGLVFCRAHGIVPGFIVGDFDSAGSDILRGYRGREDVHIRTFPPEKDWTDTELAVRLAISLGWTTIDVLGGTGSRTDHLLGNLQTMEMALKQGVCLRLVDPNNRIRMTDRPLTLRRDELQGDFLSLIPWGGPAEHVTLTGMKYPLSDALMTTDTSLGISNEVTQETARISFSDGCLLVIESRD